MDLVQTALGRCVPAHEAHTVLEDAVLDLRTFRTTGTGVGFVRNMPQGMDSLP